jgi:hypothetical protein
VTALWQGAPWDVFAVADGLVLGFQYAHGKKTVRAVSALTGAPAWTVRPPRAQPGVLGIVAGPGVVVAEVGHAVGTAPELVTSAVREDMVLDARTGKLLWTVPVTGFGAPPLAIAGSVVVSGGRLGVLTARAASTGRVLWRRSAPSHCPATGPGLINTGYYLGVAADGPLLAASYVCPGGHVLVQRLTAATGRPVWQWESPPAGGSSQALMYVTGVARQGDLVLLTGQAAPPPAASTLTRTVPRSYTWPTRLGPVGQDEVVLALDAATGRPRWAEVGGQMQGFSLADGAVCESVSIGLECRDDVTGAPTRPLLVTGQRASAAPPYGGDGMAGISGSDIAVTVAPFRAGHVRLIVVPVRGGGQLANASLDIGITARGANYQTFVVAAGTLPDGATVVLLRRIDRPGYPFVALKVASPRRS